jgi:hypothetical protein
MISMLCQVELTSNILIAYVAIHIMALIPIYVGARVSLKQKKVLVFFPSRILIQICFSLYELITHFYVIDGINV